MNAASNIQSIAINGRYRVHQVTGVQRYAREIEKRITGHDAGPRGTEVDVLVPDAGKGAIGHLWEQTVLPARSGGRLLWNPCGNGPAYYRRQIVTFHDLFPLEHPEWYSAAYARWYGFLMLRLAARAVHLIAVSEYTRSRLVKVLGCDPQRITVIHNGLTSGCERANQNSIDATHAALQLPSRRYVLSLSSLEKRKNLGATLEAWLRIQHLLPRDMWLVIAGQSADQEIYGKLDLPTGVPRVVYAGYIPEQHLAGLYSGASLFVFPSLAEGFGLPLLEAMACGVRCVASRTSSLPEVGGDTVSYIDPMDPSDLAAAIVRELAAGASPNRPFFPAMERANSFSWDKSARHTYQILQSATSIPSASLVGDRVNPQDFRPEDAMSVQTLFSESASSAEPMPHAAKGVTPVC